MAKWLVWPVYIVRVSTQQPYVLCHLIAFFLSWYRLSSTLEEAKIALWKSQDNMALYYNQYQIPASIFQPNNKIYLGASNIHTTCPSAKLSHWFLGLFEV